MSVERHNHDLALLERAAFATLFTMRARALTMPRLTGCPDLVAHDGDRFFLFSSGSGMPPFIKGNCSFAVSGS